MIKKVLIANRGEIASRIIKTCKRLNIKAVAVYSEADEHLPYVKEADESYPIGQSPVQQSYLNSDKIIEVAKLAKVDAIHPGYGFLSESSAFAKRCKQEGIIFIGPHERAIEQMGDKILARQLMKSHNVPVVPGSNGPLQSVEEAKQIAHDIGYPIMLKAAAGGGGVGMQIISDEETLVKTFAELSKRAKMYFGDGTMFLEKVITNARHIEVQIAADQFGHMIHLFDRECSIQRRHQKVIEEALAINISEQTRSKMYEAAINAARAIQYDSVGTVEFLVDETENFYFLEMNTRIQVEHPVTEQITKIDLIEMQISIANGLAISYKQDQIQQTGHAIEVRLYAEDPETFFPSPGKITNLQLPTGSHLRHELTVKEGTTVTPFYDPMIGKLIVTGKDRDDAITRLHDALKVYTIEGIKTNIPLLLKVITDNRFKRGDLSISFLETFNNNK